MPRRALVLKIVLGLIALAGVAGATALAERVQVSATGVVAVSPLHGSGLTPASPTERPDALTSGRRNDFGAAGRLRTAGAILGIAALAGLSSRRVALRRFTFSKQIVSSVARTRAPPYLTPRLHALI
jgi:hypothetical protein